MSEFKYQEPFPLGKDETKYRLLTKDYVHVEECCGRRILRVDARGLELLSREAFAEVSFYLRASHLQQVANILKDPEATDNDKFVAYTMLLNQVVAAQGELPTCQDTGTAIAICKKGEDVYTGTDDAEAITKGVYETYRDRNLRYSMVVPFTMTEEKNSGNNLPAQIDIYSEPGNQYKFLFITKGGGSANKTFLYQQTKALLNEESLTKFVREKIKDLGTSACPPYHLAVVIGGTSAEANLAAVKKASAGYYDALPTSGNEGGRAFRDLEWEAKILKICQESGIGAQFGGKYLVHDVRVIRMPRHAASCPVGIGVSCSADRNIKAKITEEGIFLEELEHNPARFLPADAPIMKPAVEIDLDEGMDKVLETLSKYPIKTRLNLKGTLIVARDIAHARIKQMLDEGKPMPEYMKNIPFIMQDRPRRRKGWRRAVSGRRPRDGWTLTWICSRVRAGRWSWWPRATVRRRLPTHVGNMAVSTSAPLADLPPFWPRRASRAWRWSIFRNSAWKRYARYMSRTFRHSSSWMIKATTSSPISNIDCECGVSIPARRKTFRRAGMFSAMPGMQYGSVGGKYPDKSGESIRLFVCHRQNEYFCLPEH